MNTDISLFKITEIASASVFSNQCIWKPAIFVLGAQPEPVYSPEIILIPCKSRVYPPLSEGGLEGN
jgi:hypothetical protein